MCSHCFAIRRCGYDQQFGNPNSPSPTDGVLGLGNGKTGVVSQLKEQGITRNVMGHCLSRKGGGFLFFGDDLVPYSKVTWAPMLRSAFRFDSRVSVFKIYLTIKTE